jgi:hypothetical protein
MNMSNREDIYAQEHAGRVNAGRAAVEHGSESDEPREELVDTLTNLMHYAVTAGLDFEDALRLAWGHHAAEIPSVRLQRFRKLCDYYLYEPEDAQTPFRYAACCKDRDDELAASGRVTTWERLQDAFGDLADQLLDGQAVDAVYDLDTAERIEIHISTPIITRSEDQGTMENPLGPQPTPNTWTGQAR